MNDDDENPEKEEHRKKMLAYFKRDIDGAKQQPQVTLGFKVWARTDAMWAHQQCQRAAQLAGVYLPDEMPALYPKDCPNEDACGCTLYEAVLSCDESSEGNLLRQKLADRGLPQPPPPWNYEKKLAEVEALERAKAERIFAAAAKKMNPQ